MWRLASAVIHRWLSPSGRSRDTRDRRRYVARVLAEIVTIGDELCRGEIVDTNATFLASELWALGVTVGWMTSCRDLREDVVRAVKDAAARASVVLVSGGLGPTEDDLTVDAIAEAAGVGVAIESEARERMEARFLRAGFTMTPNSLRQVRIPDGARVHANSAGIAPGFELALGGATLLAMPGVPRELRAIWADSAAARVRELRRGTDEIARVTLRVFGKGESHIDHLLAGLVADVPGATIHFQVVFPETLVKLVVRDPDRTVAEERLAGLAAEARTRLGPSAYGAGDDSLAAVLGRALASRGATVAVAESCTGGLAGALLTDVPGASTWFAGGVIAYANERKIADLGVLPATLVEHGAVSHACVLEMAASVRARIGATWAVAITGIAGPGGGSEAKPVGTVHVAVVGPEGRAAHKQYLFPGVREQVRRLAAYWAMALLLREVTA